MATATGFEVLPAIDLRGGRVVRLVEGDFARESVYGGDPAAMADAFARDGARWVHVVDLDGARSGVQLHGTAIAAIVASVGERARVEVAGGLRTAVSVGDALAAGAARAVIGTAALRDPHFISGLISSHGAARIAVAIDVRDGRAVGDGWSASDVGVDAAEAVLRLADAGVETFEVTAIRRDGLLGGPDLVLYERMVGLDRGVIIASGGIATLADIDAVRDAGCSGAILGRALYEGSLDLRTVMDRVG